MEPDDVLPLLDPDTRRRVVERVFAKGERLFHRGDAPASMFFVMSGEARLVRGSPAGVEVVFQRARRGFLAEASLDHAAYHCDGLAAERTVALAIPITGFRSAMASTTLQSLWVRHLSQELRRVRAHGERLALRAASDRVIHYIETEGDAGRLELRQTRKSWAAEMGLTHEALYRCLRTMTQTGVIEAAGPRIRLRAASAVSNS